MTQVKSGRSWLGSLFRLEPNLVLSHRHGIYMLRWYLIPRNPLLNLYLHKFVGDDEDRALHDHPWWFLSLMIRGKYIEFTESGVWERSSPSLAVRKASHMHRIALFRDESGNPVPCWTIVMTGPRIREWGFQCQKGWVHWKTFLYGSADSNPGCD